ncbi:hypothetical protein SAMN02745866_02809 [Alteromonadaceae bacterium Bs31]|nr:hypothetical protein SAMN02745866_02809 [Alteromonadaceae bacterium Bs31]
MVKLRNATSPLRKDTPLSDVDVLLVGQAATQKQASIGAISVPCTYPGKLHLALGADAVAKRAIIAAPH